MILRRIARPLLASAFVASGVDALRSPKPLADSAQPVVDGGREALPPTVAEWVPTDAETLIKVNAAAQIGGGVLLATGKVPRLASVILAGTVIPSTVAGNDFWNETDPVRKADQRNAFIKNVGLLGGVLLASADTEGRPSLAWRGRRRAEAARGAVAAALPFGAAAGGSALDTLRERSREGAHRLSEESEVAASRLRDGAEVVRDRAPEYAEVARERSAEALEQFRDRAPGYADAARERSAETLEQLRERAPELADAARERSAEALEKLRERAPELADAAKDFAAGARDTGGRRVDEGRRFWRKARS